MNGHGTAIPVAETVVALRSVIAHWRTQKQSIALVPTMGALHAGHVALAQEARKCADRTVISIFVNPAQFAPHEDFSRYPRNLEIDRQLIGSTGTADLIYAP